MATDLDPKSVDLASRIEVNPILPTLFVDKLQVSLRTDGLVLFQFATTMPAGHSKEEARVLMTFDHMKRIRVLLEDMESKGTQSQIEEAKA